jgi:hypothetical protein
MSRQKLPKLGWTPKAYLKDQLDLDPIDSSATLISDYLSQISDTGARAVLDVFRSRKEDDSEILVAIIALVLPATVSEAGQDTITSLARLVNLGFLVNDLDLALPPSETKSPD